jgi:hypothetical protein
MAIHSVDNKTTSMDQLLSQRQGLGTVSAAPVIEGQTTGKVVIKDNQIVVNDGTVDRIIIGFSAGSF